MKLTVEGTTEEIKNVLQAIGSSEEHKEGFTPDNSDEKPHVAFGTRETNR